MTIGVIKERISKLVIPIITFVLLISIIITFYKISVNKHYSLIRAQVFDTGELLAKEFNNIVKSDISKLENLKKRLEYTHGAYYEYWEDDASLIIEQNPSFKFVEWIDSAMVIKKVNPYKGNEKALNLDISTIEYRKDEWIRHSKSGKTNITPWAKLTQSGNSFLVDVPVYFNGRFQGTITAGMDFKTNFERIVDYLEDQYSIELYDEKGTLFYTSNKNIILRNNLDIVYKNTIAIEASEQNWHLKVFPSEKLLMADGLQIINIALIVGVFLSIIATLLVYFYVKAKRDKKFATHANLELINLNEKLNIERDRAEKASQAKTDFLSNMSHEIRTPLHAIIGFIQLIKNSNLSKTDEEYVDLMDKSSSNLLNLINDILDIDKIESGNAELDEIIFNPQEKIKELIDVTHFLFLKKNLYLKTNFENNLGINVLGDQNKLLQIVNNILKNALKFTNKGGVTVSYCEIIIKDQLKIIITIEDTGIGIPKDKLDTIFNRFTQIDNSTKKQHEGSGLGLAICKNLTTLMGGHIEVSSKINKGSKFEISISFKIAEHQEKKILNQITKNTHLSELNVLIVDDNNLNIIVLKKLLEDLKIKSDTAENGEIAILKTQKKKYQLIFMDIHMPKMDGCEATKLIREKDKEVLIFGLSANVTTESMKKAIASGMNSYLTKPFKKEHLYNLLLFHFNNM